jgi:hypothetical protein
VGRATAAHRQASILLETDNQAVFYGLRATHARSAVANCWLGDIFAMLDHARCRLQVSWAPGASNIADQYTRLPA